jgi:ectoine hydroxylase-related dioxygenase (phytanoyl-CoA dioxygenase family)
MDADQLSALKEQGYLVVENFLSPAQVARLRLETADLHTRLSDSAPPGVGVSWETNVSPKRIQQIMNAENVSPELDSVLSSSHMLSFLNDALGPDISLFHAKLIMKASASGGEIPWHQDFSYWHRQSSAPTHLNCMVAIDDADETNGCLRVIPGSHRGGLRRHREGGDHAAFTLSLDEFDPSDAVALPAKAGTAIFFGPLLAHASGPNTSSRERRSATMVFMSGAGHPYRVLGRQSDDPRVSEFFPVSSVGKIVGLGAHSGACASKYRKLELWRLARANIRLEAAPWLELTTEGSVEDSFQWLAARKPRTCKYLRIEQFPSCVSNRPDVQVVQGDFGDVLARQDIVADVASGLALVLIDCEVYAFAKQALDSVAPYLVPGTILILARFCGYDGWARETARALFEVANANGLTLELIARADQNIALRITATGAERAVATVANLDWQPKSHYIGFERAGKPGVAAAAPPHASSAAIQLLKRKFGGLRRRVGRLGTRLSLREEIETMNGFFPRLHVPVFTGSGPKGCQCDIHAQRRELWRYALSLGDNSLPWCEFGVGEGESFDWFAMYKPPQNVLLGFDHFAGIPEPWHVFPAGQWKSAVYESNRDDARIILGRFEQSLNEPKVLQELASGVGFVHVDCDLYSSTRVILDALTPSIKAGTIIVFDEFYGYEDWFLHEAKAFREYVLANGVAFEYIARTGWQVAVRILAVGVAARWSCRPPTWASQESGVQLGYEQRFAEARRLGRRALGPVRRVYHRFQ